MSRLLPHTSPPQCIYRLAVAVEQCGGMRPPHRLQKSSTKTPAPTSMSPSTRTKLQGVVLGVMGEALFGSGWKNPACDEVIPCHEKLPDGEERQERYEDRDQKDALLVREWLRLGRPRLPPQGREERWCRK